MGQWVDALLHSGWVQRLREKLREMWIRVTLFSLAGVALAVLAQFMGPFLPYVPEIDLASGSVGALLNIIASSMLAVTTFSMSIIVGAYGSATSNATPRATRLLAADNTAQNAVSIFIGSFLFSIVGIVGLSAGFYAGQARIVLFVATLLDVFLITWALLRWVGHLNGFGRMSDIIRRIEAASDAPAQLYRDHPTLGAKPLPAPFDDSVAEVLSIDSGYIRYVDMADLQDTAEAADITVEIARMSGKYVHKGETLLRVSRQVDGELADALRGAFAIGVARSFDQDVAYGIVVLSEVAGKALSPGINDPGTAIEVLRSGTRVLQLLHEPREGDPDPLCANVHAPALDVPALYAMFFSTIARDGAGNVEVQETLQDCLDHLARVGHLPAARREAARARARADVHLEEDWEKLRLD